MLNLSQTFDKGDRGLAVEPFRSWFEVWVDDGFFIYLDLLVSKGWLQDGVCVLFWQVQCFNQVAVVNKGFHRHSFIEFEFLLKHLRFQVLPHLDAPAVDIEVYLVLL
jgi:hypothetical protein